MLARQYGHLESLTVNTRGRGKNKKKVEQRKQNKVFRLTQRKPSMAPRENMPTKEIRGAFMTHKFLYLLFTLGRFHWCFGVRIGEKPTLVFHLIKNFDQFNRQKMCCIP